jgi:hypothetical protein
MFWQLHTAIGTHSRFTRQFLGYAEMDRLARALFYDFPVILFFLGGTRRTASKGSGPAFDGQSLAS